VRVFPSLVRTTARMSAPEIPGHRLSRTQKSIRRRLCDDVEDVFYRACAVGDLETAADLATAMENLQARRQQKYGRDRRINDCAIIRARAELDRRRALRPPLAA
jgi:hypothetical protein